MADFINHKDCRTGSLIYCLNSKVDTLWIEEIPGSARAIIHIIDAAQRFPLPGLDIFYDEAFIRRLIG